MGLLKFFPDPVIKTGQAPSSPVLPSPSTLSSGLMQELGVLAAERVYRSRGEGRSVPPVAESADLTRILAIPRRKPPSLQEQAALAAKWTNLLQYENTNCQCRKLRPNFKDPLTGLHCITRLHPIQGWYLEEAFTVGGALGHLAIGSGKTGLDCLLATVVPNVSRAILLIPPSLREEFFNGYEEWRQHFRVPNLAGYAGPFYPDRPVLEMVPYSTLSNPDKRQALLASAATVPKGELILIGDEADKLSRMSARTKRVIDFIQKLPETRVFWHSGTLTDDSISNYFHLSLLALRGNSPLPADSNTVKEWGAVLDAVVPVRPPIGALRRLCVADEPVRSAFRKRLVETAGVVTSNDARLPIRLVLSKRDPGGIPKIVQDALTSARDGVRPDWMAPGSKLAQGQGKVLADQLEIAVNAYQIATGSMYRWKFPKGEPKELIDEWFSRRKAWNRELREELEVYRRNLDSPALLERAAIRYNAGVIGTNDEPSWKSQFYNPWVSIRDSVYHEQETIWFDEWLAKDAVKWGKESPGIIWFKHTCLGHKIAQLGNFTYYGKGARAAKEIRQESGQSTIVASIAAHAVGRNLQQFSRNLIVEPPSTGRIFSQLLGRCHRYGQTKDTVTAEVYLHTPEFIGAYANAMKKVTYAEESTGEVTKLLYAEKVNMPEVSEIQGIDVDSILG